MLHISIKHYFSVDVGLCDDPFNGTYVYYYGDIANQTCGPGMEPIGIFYIQCITGESSDVTKWNASLPRCTGNDNYDSTLDARYRIVYNTLNI